MSGSKPFCRHNFDEIMGKESEPFAVGVKTSDYGNSPRLPM
jgi:hypothetical protein